MAQSSSQGHPSWRPAPAVGVAGTEVLTHSSVRGEGHSCGCRGLGPRQVFGAGTCISGRVARTKGTTHRTRPGGH